MTVYHVCRCKVYMKNRSPNRGDISCQAIWGSLYTRASKILPSWVNNCDQGRCFDANFSPGATLSEEIANPTLYHHLSQLSVDIQLNGLIKCREDSGVQMQQIQVIFQTLSWISPEPAALREWTSVISSWIGTEYPLYRGGWHKRCTHRGTVV